MSEDENGGSLKIPGWFVRLNLIVIPFLVAPVLSWLIWKAINNSERIQRLESQVEQLREAARPAAATADRT